MLRSAVALLLFGLAIPLAAAQPVAAPVGSWITQNHYAVIQIVPCGNDLCGQIVGLALRPGEPMPRDWQGVSQCGLTILRTAPADAGAWAGSILDPRNGSVYNARIAVDAAHDLQLRGYIGLPILGRTQTWTPYNGPVPSGCRLPTG